MKRYILFAFYEYYPGGGLNDFMFDFENEIEFSEKFDTENRRDYYNVLDTRNPFFVKNSFDKKRLIEFIKANVD